MNIHCYSEFRVASHADVLRGFSRVPAPLTSGPGTHDEPLPLAKQSTSYAFTNGYKNFLNESGDECCKSSSRLSRKSFVRFNKGAKLFERMLIIDLFTVYDAILAGGQTRLKLQLMYPWDFGPLGTAITPLQIGGFPTFATTL